MAKTTNKEIKKPEDLKALAVKPNLVKKYESIEIVDTATAEKVGAIIKQEKQNIKDINAKAKPLLDAIKQSKKHCEAMLKEALAPSEAIIAILDKKAIAWVEAETARIKRETEKLQKKENKKAEKLSAKLGEDIRPTLIEPEKVTVGSTSVRKTARAVVVDRDALPPCWLIPDQTALNAEARRLGDKLDIPGVKVEWDSYTHTR